MQARTHAHTHTYLSTSVHDGSNARDEIRRLLSNLSGLVVQPPKDGAADLREIGLHSRPQGIYNHTKSVEHDYILREREGENSLGWVTTYEGKFSFGLTPPQTGWGGGGGGGGEGERTTNLVSLLLEGIEDPIN